jgi:hypothetical protein
MHAQLTLGLQLFVGTNFGELHYSLIYRALILAGTNFSGFIFSTSGFVDLCIALSDKELDCSHSDGRILTVFLDRLTIGGPKVAMCSLSYLNMRKVCLQL